MSTSRRLVTALRRLDRQAPEPARRLARVGRKAARKAARSVIRRTGVEGRIGTRLRHDPDLVTVVVTVSAEDLEYLDEAMDSVVNQVHQSLEIIVVPYGPDDAAVRSAIGRWSQSEHGLRVLSAHSADLATARDRGARAGHGHDLCFLRGHDVLPEKAISEGIAALRRSGSDFVVGRISNPTSVMRSVLPRQDRIHDRNRYGVTLADFPAAVADSGLGNRLFDAAFWRRARLSFGGAQGESDVVLAAFQHATAFDAITTVTYRARDRAYGTPVEQLYDSTADLSAWLSDASNTRLRLRTLESNLGGGLVDHWAVGVIDQHLQTFLGDTERMSDQQWQSLRTFARGLLDTISDQAWTLTRAESRVKLRLLLNNRRTDLELFIADRWFEQDNVATRLIGDRVSADFPLAPDAVSQIPTADFALAEHETPARVRVRNVTTDGSSGPDERGGPDRLRIDLLARIELLDLSEATPEISARWLAYDDDDQPVASVAPITAEVAPVIDEQANMSIGHRYQDYRRGGCRVQTDLAALGTGRWRLEITVTVGAITRTTDRMTFDGRGSAGLIGSRYQPRRCTTVGTTVAVKRGSGHLDLVVRDGEPIRLTSARIEDRRISVRLEPVAARRLTSITVQAGGQQASADVHDDVATLDVPVPLPDGPRAWKVRATTEDGNHHPVAWPIDADEQIDPSDGWIGVGDSSVVIRRSEFGNVMLYEARHAAILDDVALIPGGIAVRGRWLTGSTAIDDVPLLLTATGRRCAMSAPISTAADGSFTAEVSLRWDPWGLGEHLVPRDEYYFDLSPVEGDRESLAFVPDLHVSQEFIDSMLTFRLSDEVRMRPICKPAKAPGFALSVPNRVEDSGSYAQNELQQATLTGLGPIDQRAVYLSTYNGGVATDSPAAIHAELRRRYPDLKLYWGVNDPSTLLPEGGIGVLINSQDWYRIVSTARYLVQNVDFPRWWRKREGQQFLQTFHGYPAKSMGLRMWRAKKFTPLRQQIELERTRSGWDLILTPAPEMDVHYREEYDYSGPIHSAGYPRDDALVQPDADTQRDSIRQRLGIRPDQRVILYAPTWRDHLASSYTSADIVEYLDVERASEELGDDYVFLLRGHRFNTRRPERDWNAARILDVTDYPEINDLILASDVAVLDYSSLRFDFGLTDRPMVFLVPDLSDYTGGIRGFLFDYADSAPGPLLQTTDEVLEVLRDLPALADQYRDRIDRFNQTYQYLQDGFAAARVVDRFFPDLSADSELSGGTGGLAE